ncbi:MAG TPA: hypothetical protein PLO62_02065 [Candidatus Hydrogenedentes bacterium]|nr:hypothetical protein [Candidatus Hydrogenedentota bacterium]
MHENEISERIVGATIDVHLGRNTNFRELRLVGGIKRIVNCLE